MLSNILNKKGDSIQGTVSVISSAAAPVSFSSTSSRAAAAKTVLSSETEFKGTLGFQGDLELYGRIEGSIESDSGLLTIGETALVKAEIRAQNIIVYGKIQGNIIATERIELRGKAQVYGDIRSGRLIVEEGVTFVGRSENLNAAPQEKPDFGQIFTKIGTSSDSSRTSSAAKVTL